MPNRMGRVGKVGIRKNAVVNTPRIDPTVETAESRPAAEPTSARSRAARRTAKGVTAPMSTLGGPKRTTAARSARKRSGTGAPLAAARTPSGAAKSTITRAPAARRTRERSSGMGLRSASRPPERISGGQRREERRDEGAPDEERRPENGSQDAAPDDLERHERGPGEEDRRVEAEEVAGPRFTAPLRADPGQTGTCGYKIRKGDFR